ncbi:hypothetical protein O3P69_012688, partial [Scylla paramamosain]
VCVLGGPEPLPPHPSLTHTHTHTPPDTPKHPRTHPHPLSYSSTPLPHHEHPLPDEIPLPGGWAADRAPHPYSPRRPLIPPPSTAPPTDHAAPWTPPPNLSLPPPVFHTHPRSLAPSPRHPGPVPLFSRMPGTAGGQMFPTPPAERYSPSRVTADDDDATPTPSLSHPPPTPALTKPPPVPLPTTTTTTTTSDATAPSTSAGPPPGPTPSLTVAPPTASKTGVTKLLGSKEAKKRLLAFSGKTMKVSSFTLTKTPRPAANSALPGDDDVKKGPAPTPGGTGGAKKKKKEEKVSIIVQIRDEESRLKQALGLKNIIFNPYGPGLAPIAKLLDTPEELKRFEPKGCTMKVRPEENEARQNRNKERRRRDRPERVDRMDRPRAKEKDRRTDAQATQDAKAPSDASGKDEPRKRPRRVPKSWKEFKSEKFDFELLRQVRRDQMRRQNRGARGGAVFKDPKMMYPIRAKGLGGSDKEYPASLVRYTNARPSISFAINSAKFRAHFFSRTEIRHYQPEEWSALEAFWSAPSTHLPPSPPRAQKCWYLHVDNWPEEVRTVPCVPASATPPPAPPPAPAPPHTSRPSPSGTLTQKSKWTDRKEEEDYMKIEEEKEERRRKRMREEEEEEEEEKKEQKTLEKMEKKRKKQMKKEKRRQKKLEKKAKKKAKKEMKKKRKEKERKRVKRRRKSSDSSVSSPVQMEEEEEEEEEEERRLTRDKRKRRQEWTAISGREEEEEEEEEEEDKRITSRKKKEEEEEEEEEQEEVSSPELPMGRGYREGAERRAQIWECESVGADSKESSRESSPKRGRTGALRVTPGSGRSYPASDTSGYYDLTPDSSSGASGAKTFNLEDIPYPTRESERYSPSNMSLSSSSSAPPTPPHPPTPDTLDAIPIPPPTLDLTNIPMPPVTFTITPPVPHPQAQEGPPAKTQAPGPPSSHGSCPTAPLIRPLALPHAGPPASSTQPCLQG